MRRYNVPPLHSPCPRRVGGPAGGPAEVDRHSRVAWGGLLHFSHAGSDAVVGNETANCWQDFIAINEFMDNNRNWIPKLKC